MHLKTWVLTDRQLCDCEMILDKSFYPLDGFMNKNEYDSVINDMRLSNGVLFPIPIVLDVNKEFSDKIAIGEKIILCEKEGFQIAYMTIKSIWEPNFLFEANKVYGTKDNVHPAVDYLYNKSNKIYIGGKIEKITLPNHYDYKKYRISPYEVKRKFKTYGWDKIVAFQTRNPLHRAHVEMTVEAMKKVNASLLLHPVVGLTKPGDVDHYTRVRCYEHVLKKYPKNSTLLALLPLAMRMGGPREALLHAIIRKNYGCTHFIIGRDHAGPGNDKDGNPFYGPYEAQDLVQSFESELDIKMVMFKMVGYHKIEKKYVSLDDPNIDKNDIMFISGTQLRDKLNSGEDIPDWFTYSDITDELRKTYPPKLNRGFTIFFTGLSGSGKSTIANAVEQQLTQNGFHTFLLDGDNIRHGLNKDLGFTEADRIENIRRIGEVSKLMTDAGLIVITAFISPFQSERNMVRELVDAGEFIEIFVDTPLQVAEKRDVKGLYAKARAGELKNFTGIDSPYERPSKPEITIDTAELSVDEAADTIVKYYLSSITP